MGERHVCVLACVVDERRWFCDLAMSGQPSAVLGATFIRKWIWWESGKQLSSYRIIAGTWGETASDTVGHGLMWNLIRQAHFWRVWPLRWVKHRIFRSIASRVHQAPHTIANECQDVMEFWLGTIFSLYEARTPMKSKLKVVNIPLYLSLSSTRSYVGER